jgi:hypothetical protein
VRALASQAVFPLQDGKTSISRRLRFATPFRDTTDAR